MLLRGDPHRCVQLHRDILVGVIPLIGCIKIGDVNVFADSEGLGWQTLWSLGVLRTEQVGDYAIYDLFGRATRRSRLNGFSGVP